MKRAFLVILLATIVPIACFTAHGSGVTGITLDPQQEQHIAAGARFDVAVVDTCSDAKTALRGEGQGKIPTAIVIDIGVQTCEFSSVERIDRAQSSDEAVLTVDGTAAFDQYGIITLLAHREGVASVSTEIATSTGVYQPTGTYHVQVPNAARLVARCDNSAGRGAGTINALAGLPLTFDYQLLHDNQALIGYDYYPFDLGELEIRDGGVADFSVMMPAASQSIAITSPVDPELDITLDVHTLEDLDAINFQLSSETCSAGLRVAPSAGDAAAFCNDNPDVQLTIETPDSCSFRPHTQELVSVAEDSYDGRVAVYSTAAGSCRIRADVVGGSHSEHIEIPFSRCTTWTKTLDHPVLELADAGPQGVLVFADDGQGVFLDDGSSVLPHAELPSAVEAAWAESPERFGFTAFDMIYTQLGDERTSVEAPTTYLDACLLGPDDVLLVGRGAARFRDGAIENLSINEFGSFTGVWADSEALAYAVGTMDQGMGDYDGKVRVFNGESWAEAHPDVEKQLHDVWGSAADDVYAVGSGVIKQRFEDGVRYNYRTGGVIMHFDGDSWDIQELEEGMGLNAVSGQGADQVVAVGDAGVVMRWDGAIWETFFLRGAGDLRAVLVRPDGRVLVGGSNGLFELR